MLSFIALVTSGPNGKLTGTPDQWEAAGALYTIDQLIFKRKELTFAELKAAMADNYQSAPEKVSVTLPFANAEVFDVLNKKSIPQKELKALQVPNAKVRLLYIKKK